MALKGLYFSLDAVIGLMLVGLAVTLIASTGGLSEGVTGDEIRFDQYTQQAVDISYLIREEDFSALNKTYRDELIANTAMKRENTDNIAEAILLLEQANEPEAEELAEEYLNTFKHDSGLYIEGRQIAGVDASEQASSKFMALGNSGPKTFTVVVGE